MAPSGKDPNAFVTIGELSAQLGVPQHILRYWETKFPQLRPLQRAGNRRYYRPADVALAERIHRLLGTEGYTVRGVQKLLREGPAPAAPSTSPPPQPEPAVSLPAPPTAASPSFDYGRLVELRDRLAAALAG